MPDSAALAQFLASGLTTGCGYALVALAIVLVANVSGVVNLAQGEYCAIGGLVLASLLAVQLPVTLCLLLVALLGTVLGVVQERATIRPIQRDAHFLQITVTLGVAVMLRGGAFLIWGKDPLAARGFSGDGVIEFAGAIFPVQTLWVWGGTAVLLLFIFLVLVFTQTGRAIRACSINREAAQLMGINPRRTSVLVLAAAGAASTLSGAFLAPLTLASWDSGLTLGLKGLIAAIFGGFKNPVSAVVAGLVIGILESFIAGLGSSDARDVFLYALLLAGLLAMGGVFARGRDRLRLGSAH